MLELFTVGTWLFWVLFVVFSMFVVGYSDSDRKGGLVLATIIFVGLFYNSWSSKLHLELKDIAIYGGSYIVIGMIWTIIKWWLHVKRIQVEITQIPDGTNDRRTDEIRSKLDPTQNKARITTWGVYWPWSMFWSMIHDTVDMAYQALLNRFRSISAGALRDLEAKTRSITAETRR